MDAQRTPDELDSRVTAYLAGGGLFNPELANHDAVRDLIIACRDEIKRLREYEWMYKDLCK